MSKVLLWALLALFLLALGRLIVEGEWYLVASLVSGIILARDEVRKLLDDAE